MGVQITDHGVARGIVNTLEGERLKVDAEEKKFVTFVNEQGAAHTVVVAAEHPAETAEELVKWFLNTKAAAESGRFDNDPGGVLDHADQVTQEGHPFASPDKPADKDTEGGAG